MEGDSAEEARQLREALTKAREEERARFDIVYNVGYFFCVVFEAANQADAFLKAVGWREGDGDVFIDGRLLADHMDIDLPKAEGIYDTGKNTMPADLVRRPKGMKR